MVIIVMMSCVDHIVKVVESHLTQATKLEAYKHLIRCLLQFEYMKIILILIFMDG